MDGKTKEKIIDALFMGALEGGITITNNGTPITKGYSVAVATDHTTCCSGTDQEIRDCISDFVDRISDKSDNKKLGVWYDEENKKYVLDISRNVNTERTATLIGWLFNQRAIYNHNTKEEIFI